MSAEQSESKKRKTLPVEEGRPEEKGATLQRDSADEPAIKEFYSLESCPEDSGILITYCPIDDPTVDVIDRALDLADEYDEATKVAAKSDERQMNAAVEVRNCIDWLLGESEERPDALELERFELGGMLPTDFKNWVPQKVMWPPYKFPAHYRFKRRAYACWC